MFILFKVLICVEYDGFGVMFENGDYQKLILAPDTLISYIIPNSVIQICGGSEKDSAFYNCRSKLTSIFFQEGSKLEILDKYSFYQCNIKGILDLSPCKELKILSESAFAFCKLITNIIFPPNIDTIKSGCFRACEGIISLSFPKSLRKINGYDSIHGSSFSNCNSLCKVEFDSDAMIESIGSDGFSSCSLSSFYIPKRLKSFIGSSLLDNPITHVEVDPLNEWYSSDGLTITNKANTSILYFCGYGAVNYTVSYGIETLGDSAFRFSILEYIILPSTLKSIKGFCFLGSKIKEITLGSHITSIEMRTFEGCSKLKKVIWEAQTSIIPYQTFRSCSSLEEFYVPNGVKELEANVFYGCSSINYIFISKSVEKIGSGCFRGINKTAEIVFENGSSFIYDDGILYSSDKKNLISCLETSKESIQILSSIELISGYAFSGTKLETVDFSLANNLVTIEQRSFDSNSLKAVIFPSNIQYISCWSFNNNKDLETIDFSKCTNLSKIGPYAFSNTKITTVEFPKSLCHLYDRAFDSVSTLTSIDFLGENLITIGNNAFSNTKIKKVIIPINTVNISSEAFSGSSLQTLIFNRQSNIKKINSYSFYNCAMLTLVDLCEGIESIGKSAFEGCTSLEELSLVNSIENISINSFKDCKSLTTVTIPDGSQLKNIEGLAFENCFMLKSFQVTEKNLYFSSEAGVLYDKEYKEIVIYLPASEREVFEVPESVSVIRAYSFQGATNLRSVNISGCSVERIGFKAFSGCTNLESLILPSTLRNVDSLAFENCQSLGCGSVIYWRNEGIEDELMKGGIHENALSPCPTELFSVVHGKVYISEILIMGNSIISEGE